MTPDNSLTVWDLRQPTTPVKVGVVSLSVDKRGLVFTYDKNWLQSGFQLSGDMPLQPAPIFQKTKELLLGAMDDAMPDRWGERAIRFLDKPKRAVPLDFLYYAGDRRFGALGFSIDENSYVPHNSGPIPTLGSIDALSDLITRIDLGEPLSAQESLIAGTTKTMGGAHPKALVMIDNQEWIAKFQRGSNLDIPLIEHATMRLANSAGIQVSETISMATNAGHVVAVKRFDRDNGIRLHVLSAKTALLHGVSQASPALDELSYGAMADFLRQNADPVTQTEQRHELFRRMAFNILVDNTDDHEKNHAFIFDGRYWYLAPAFDLIPLLSNAGVQQMIVGDMGAEGTLENALSQHARFGLSRQEAIDVWFQVADQVSQWKSFYKGFGVTASDIAEMETFLDATDKLDMRSKSAIQLILLKTKRNQ